MKIVTKRVATMQAEIKIKAEAMSEDISPSSSESESSELIDAVCPNTKNS